MTDPLYQSPRGLYDFQADGVARCYLTQKTMPVWDTGTGKSHLGMATAALMFEDGLIDLMLVVCEQNKVDEWFEDFGFFTKLSRVTYYGDKKKRAKILATLSETGTQVLITTYETARNDMAEWEEYVERGKKKKRLVGSSLTEALREKRVLLIYDEVTKLGNRGSGLHKAHDIFVKAVRKFGYLHIMGLTATPIERSPENFYNLGRIICPELVGTVASFETEHILTKNFFGNPDKFKNLTLEDRMEPWVTPLAEKMRPVLLRKRKTDPDVIAQFPQTQEDFKYVHLGDRHQSFYETVIGAFEDADEMTQRSLFITMRQIACHPLALMRSQSEVAKVILSEVGVDGLKALGSAKTDALVQYLLPLVHGQGAQAVVFSFFGPSVLPLLQQALSEAKPAITSVLHYGEMSKNEKDKARNDFKAGKYQVFLTSDAGARGINLPEASYAIEYEMALTHSNRTQRLNRIHRVNSKHLSVTFMSMVALDTVEEGIAQGVLRRNEWSDKLLEDEDAGEGFVSAKDRKRLLQIARRTAIASRG